MLIQVQCPNSIAEHTYDYYSYWENYLWSPRAFSHRSKRSSLADEDKTTSATTSKDIVEDQK